MFHKKIIDYRKKNMWTQEELAEKLSVSRQTITKWESGLITPNLEYLIDLSQLFHVTLDALVKDDDCHQTQQQLIEPDDLLAFIVEAKQKTYASQQNKITALRTDAHEYAYQKQDYRYVDSFFGASTFYGQEVVYHHEQAYWVMNYQGQVLDERFRGDFLKEALKHVPYEMPYRGPLFYQQGEYTYICHSHGPFHDFHGDEFIYYQSQLIYQGRFHGGTTQ